MSDTPPDRLSVDPSSPHHDAEVLQRGVGIRFKGEEKTNVEEYCVSEGWVRLAVGNRVDRNHVGGRVTERVDRQCRTVQDSSQSSRVVAYNVSYRNPDGTTRTRTIAQGLPQPNGLVMIGNSLYVLAVNRVLRYDNIEVVEIDGLEGDDEFFVRSTAFGVSYRVIGGLGSDAFYITGDVTSTIVSGEVGARSGFINHFIASDDDVKTVFDRQFDTMVSELAHDLKLTLTPADGQRPT